MTGKLFLDQIRPYIIIYKFRTVVFAFINLKVDLAQIASSLKCYVYITPSLTLVLFSNRAN